MKMKAVEAAAWAVVFMAAVGAATALSPGVALAAGILPLVSIAILLTD
jgi:hypothetical protein